MIAVWYKEWREFTGNRRTALLRLTLPLLLLAPFMRGETVRIPVLVGAVAWLGAYGTAAQIARERVSGFLPRLALTPVPAGRMVLHRVLCRTLLLALQLAPPLALAAWHGAPPAQTALLVPALPASVAAGAIIGLRAPSRRSAQLAGLAVAVASAFAGWGAGPLPAPGKAGAPLTLMSTTPGLPLHLSIWLLIAGLLFAVQYAASSILGTPDESDD